MFDDLRALSDCVRNRVPAIWVTVAHVRGSTPREVGAKMLVTPDSQHGTIGGGNLEFKAIEIARELLIESMKRSANAASATLRRFPLGPELGQCCGGVAELLFEPLSGQPAWLEPLNQLTVAQTPVVMVTPVARLLEKLLVTVDTCLGAWPDAELQARAVQTARASNNLAGLHKLDENFQVFIEPVRTVDFHIDIYGAGHVGKALIQVLSGLPCRIRWIDSRAEQFPATVPANVEIIISETPELEADDAPSGSYILVMSHSHPLDQAICERYLRRGGYRYLGLIGSASKKRKFEQRLRRIGISAEQWATLTCPIGIPGIDGKHPAEIAIAVAAELLQVRQKVGTKPELEHAIMI